MIEKDDGKLNLKGTSKSFSQKAILDLADNNPELFSPNVILRPLYQEIILPNLAYVGGGGELAYWLQLKSLFEHFEVNFPMLILRNSALIEDKYSAQKLAKLELDIKDLFTETETLKKAILPEDELDIADLTSFKYKIQTLKEDLLNQANKLDASLKGSVEGEWRKMEKGLDNLENKFIRASKRKNETKINQLEKLKEKLFPSNSLQERKENVLPYYFEWGQAFIDFLVEEFDVFDKEFYLIKETT